MTSTVRRACIGLLVLVGPATLARGQSNAAAHAAVPVVRTVRTSGPVVIDGRLDDAVWQQAPPATVFTQRDPDEGKPATEDTELRVAFDAEALYVGVRLLDREPAKIARQLARRDRDTEADFFSLFLDPHHDHLTGASFTVSAAGVQGDAIIYNDTSQDDSWDAVWESAVTVDDRGWTVEMRIPFSQLRFPAAEHHTFGINAVRQIQRKHEQAWLVQVPKTETGLASRFAHLEGIESVSPKRTAELLPYVTTRAEFIDPQVDGDPFNDGSRLFAGTGLDVKYRVTSNLSLDGTINPDFGQVEVDPAVVNLSAFETFYEEKRPFFIEGANIFTNFGHTGSNSFWGFNRAEPNLFYSRRIGRAPQGPAEGTFVDVPTATTILGAAKLTGKTRSGWSLGLLEAVTASEEARTITGDMAAKAEVEPLTNYVVTRAQREIAGRAGLGFIGTAVNRDLQVPSLASTLPGDAYVAGTDGHYFFDKKRDWVFTGSIAGSHVAGSQESIDRLQREPQRYFQRPDASHLHLDPTATSLDGWTGSLNLNRQGGVHGVNAALWSVSPGFDSSDAGFTFASDRAGAHMVYQYRGQNPNRFSRSRFASVAKWYTWNFGREKQGDGLHMFGNMTLKNYWTFFGNFAYFGDAQDDRATRGGPSMLSPSATSGFLGVESDSRRRLSVGANGSVDATREGGYGRSASMNVQYRPNSSLDIRTGPAYQRNHQLAQYVGTFTDPIAASTYGGRYVFGTLDQKEFAFETRVNYILSPKVSLQVYLQPLVSVGDYTGFKELAQPRTYDFVRYGTDRGTLTYDERRGVYTVDPGDGGAAFTFGNPDFNFKSLRLNAIFRWEWRPGSAMYLVWTEQRQDTDHAGSFAFSRDVGRLFVAPADDVFLFKIAYWFQR